MEPMLVAVFALAIAVTGPTAREQNQDPWSNLRFLLGDWAGEGTGAPGEGIGLSSFRAELGDKVLIRRNRVTFAPKPGESQGAVHEDLLIVYREQEKLRAIYFDGEGHVIQYGVSTSLGKVVFESEATEGAPRFRLSYEATSPERLSTTFATATGGGEFKTYLTGIARRVAK